MSGLGCWYEAKHANFARVRNIKLLTFQTC